MKVMLDNLPNFPYYTDSLYNPIGINVAFFHVLWEITPDLRSAILVRGADDVKEYLLSEWSC